MPRTKKTMDAREIIAKHHGKVTKSYSLISNWGYTVTHKGSTYDVRRWANCYGSDCGWGVMWISSKGGEKDEAWIEALEKDLNNYELNNEW